jgi:hypothetical protein
MTTIEFDRLNTSDQVNIVSEFILNFIDSEKEGYFTPQNVLAGLLVFSDCVTHSTTED